ncbi:MAG: electron transfer flavoprotein subunit alpha/FixB family protein [Bacteroidales bacterium]|nr:electron transfer flavoprotein subunit alpha/FixB family protein [Bacteroidales bacterium]MCL2133636.1 electron transfer flavoprotein subunit alpha/FixB family protein [Bacteroidales bacterium]
MNNIFVYCELEGTKVAEVSLELLTKARSLAAQVGVKVEALVIGHKLEGIEKELMNYGAEIIHLADDQCLEPFRTLPHTAITVGVMKEVQPQVALFGASSIGRDLAPRVSSALKSGLTADCTSLEIGDHTDTKGNTYKNLLYQIRPAFGGNIIATIINPECRPQMATVREGVMKKEVLPTPVKAEVVQVDVKKYLNDTDFAVRIIERHIEERKIDIKGAGIIVSGGYGVGSKENFNQLFDLAAVLGGEVGASRAAVDSGYADHARQVGQTGITVRPKLYIACGISGQIQHTAGMDQSAIIISINTDSAAPINQIADYAIVGDLNEVIPKMIASYRRNSK